VAQLSALQVKSSADATGKRVFPQAEFVDVAGLVRGASKGEGLGNQFLATIRECDCVLHVVRCFGGDGEDDKYAEIEHVEGKVDAVRDLETILLELQLSDLHHIDRARERLAKKVKSMRGGEGKADLTLLDDISKRIDGGGMAGEHEVTARQAEMLQREVRLLTAKPAMYACNVGEEDILSGNDQTQRVKEWLLRNTAGTDEFEDGESTRSHNPPVFNVCARVEEELSQLMEEDSDPAEVLAMAGLERSSLEEVASQARGILRMSQV
jgi:ribosome-binding ATPase